MTDDAALLKLLSAASAARAKVVMVGDHRQLGAVGPGGGLSGCSADAYCASSTHPWYTSPSFSVLA